MTSEDFTFADLRFINRINLYIVKYLWKIYLQTKENTYETSNEFLL